MYYAMSVSVGILKNISRSTNYQNKILGTKQLAKDRATLIFMTNSKHILQIFNWNIFLIIKYKLRTECLNLQ